MADIVCETQTFFRKNEMGRFVSRLQEKGENMLDDMVEDGQDEARRLAPRGSHSYRSGHTHFKDSVREVNYSGGQERGWATTAKHFWWYVRGTKPHLIKGKLSFNWANTGDWFHWENYRYGPYGSGKRYENWDSGAGATVKHPGNGPHDNWMLASYRAIAARAPSYMRRAF